MNSENRPNLVYVFADQLRYRSVGYNGDPSALTPHIDALARESVNLDNAVSNHPVCAPYRASLFTGDRKVLKFPRELVRELNGEIYKAFDAAEQRGGEKSE